MNDERNVVVKEGSAAPSVAAVTIVAIVVACVGGSFLLAPLEHDIINKHDNGNATRKWC